MLGHDQRGQRDRSGEEPNARSRLPVLPRGIQQHNSEFLTRFAQPPQFADPISDDHRERAQTESARIPLH